MKNKNSRRSSDILLLIASDKSAGKTVSYRYLFNMLGERAFGLVLLFFALPSALPLSAIPGVALVFSIPLALCSLQMILGRQTLWIPGIIARRSVEHETLKKMIEKALPFLVKMEQLLRPRLVFLFRRPIEMVTGFCIFILSILLMLPIPFSNFILSGLIILFSLGFIEKDGLFILMAYIGSLVYFNFLFFLVRMLLPAF
ncbi:exopolysaccharide biosynthesis protein [Legionella israelensis]|uniref:Exopolysaccharide biosynthesis protein n=1 Tax=Legionella israelensis TaxID=454 RepID=A0A0W0WI53_9GAMM|nr:exopolysaccharide biosynthesis protein [Legionella israelensis]KTD32017.1 proton transporter [Legionella israelensis]QBR85004.1 exopolysaccharide biosynthesis protein [Legionella israelensis]QBS10104.1 exopolysaccharide biosynthesis protein [Legionella israelensis]SCX96921.1 Uncharacterized conserved protein [Legionella israelensis DSM 19235]STX59689.1 ABC transporter permease [Legionella israelensis]